MKAPCGHEGEPIIGTFVNCRTKGCSGLPPKPTAQAFDDEESTRELCAMFGCSGTMKPYDFGTGQVRRLYPNAVKCDRCGRVKWS